MASFELDLMLGRGEVISKLEMSRHELCEHGDEPFDLYFSPIRDVQPCLTLKVAVVQTRGKPLLHSLRESEIDHRTYTGHIRLAKYVTTHKNVAELTRALKQFRIVLDQYPVIHVSRAAALTHLAWARLQGYIRKDLQDIHSTISLFRDALALCSESDYLLYVYHLTEALTRLSPTAHSIGETVQLYHELLSLCPEGTYLRSIAIGKNCVGYVIRQYNNLPIDVSDKAIHLRRTVLKLCQLGHQCRLDALTKLAEALEECFVQCGSINNIDESIRLRRGAVSLCPRGHPDHGTY